ncbi:MAG: serine hydrolase [Chloroflexi bacterium]|nr:serine hydrolase [Chloroflexota bacterium]MYD65236.1 serine hydrolase [Chloroflexota bacterium]
MLGAAVEEAMDGYVGGWGLALIDLDCEQAILVHPQHGQYPASAGKIVIVVTALRAVQAGELPFEGEVREDVETIMAQSLDAHSDRLNDKLTSAQIAAVLERAGASGASEYEHSWRYAHLTPLDLARVWTSLVRGEQLDEEWTAYLLDLATRPELGPGFWPFPAAWGVEGYEYGQKAGYWTSPRPIGYRVSAGFARPDDGSSQGYVFAFMIRAVADDLAGWWQRPVFTLVRDFVVGELGRVGLDGD